MGLDHQDSLRADDADRRIAARTAALNPRR
jgi:hypothetical protein